MLYHVKALAPLCDDLAGGQPAVLAAHAVLHLPQRFGWESSPACSWARASSTPILRARC
jgi:hypothetical protein